MTLQELDDQLNYINHSREKRSYYARLIAAQPELFPMVLDLLFMVDNERSNRAAWLCEFVCKENLSILYPYLDLFTQKMNTVYKDSALRPVAKITEYLTLSYYKKQDPRTRKALTHHHKQRLVETGFDWMITKQKVAVQAYTMTSLFWLGTEIDWVHPELHRIMEDGYASGSAAYKARCRHIFEAIRKFRVVNNHS